MKILMTADPIGGVWGYALELCAALRAYGAQIMLATLGAPLSPSQRDELRALPHVELRESRYRLEWMESPWESLEEAGTWLLLLEREFEPDVVHMNHLVHAHLDWKAPTVVVGHSCVMSWWEAVHGQPAVGMTQYRDAVATSLQAADVVIAPSRAMLSALSRLYGPLSCTRVIANGRDSRHFGPGPKQPLIFCAARFWDEAKNVRALCDVANEVRWPIYVAGQAVSPAGRGSETPGVRTLGHLSPTALCEWYAKASIYALPARYEPFGLTPLEAALSDCALVLGDIDSLREVWGECAAYVPPCDRNALRDVLNGLISHPTRRRRLASLARERAQKFSPAVFAAAYWNVYQSLTDTQETRECASSSSITR